MSVDFDAIARAGRCDVSSLRLALPLIEQGYSPPFLARYRRDELSGIDESSLWALSNAVTAEQRFSARREELKSAWEQTTLRDPSIGHAIEKASTARVLTRIARLLKSESSDTVDDATRLAVRILNPQKGDGTDLAEIAGKVDEIQDPAAATAGLDQALAKRLLNDPRIMKSATRWLARNAKIHIENISDPHGNDQEQVAKAEKGKAAKGKAQQAKAQQAKAQQAKATKAQPAKIDQADASGKPSASQPEAPAEKVESPTESAATESAAAETVAAENVVTETPASEVVETAGAAAETTDSEATPSGDNRGPESPQRAVDDAAASGAAQTAGGEGESNVTAPSTDAESASASPGAEKSAPAKSAPAKSQSEKPVAAAKKPKKVSPRQRRRRWLVGVLKPLSGKRFKSDKLSAFQIVMLGRALRSQVAKCAFEYDATKLVAEIQKTAIAINRPLEAKLREFVLEHEANIREAAESAWWDDLAERASARLVNVAADHLRRHVNRGGVDAKVILSIDAVGPRTAAAAIVTSDGRLLHSEDIPCQLSAAQRSQAVTKMGELIHHFHVDLIVISNGPARRASMIALGDLIKQSPAKSIRWTLADRSGADAYSGGPVADQEMRSTPRRFRAAAWLAYSVLQPAKAITKVDPLKLRLSSFQRELSDEAISGALDDVLISGVSRGGVDVNSAPASWLARLPGMNADIADAIDGARRKSLFRSRDAITELEPWDSVVQSRQAIAFLRVFGSEEVLDGTLVHPEDYALASKLAKSLEIDLPPNAPPGYQPPTFDSESPVAEPAQLTAAETKPEPAPVEDFTAAGEKSPEFQVPSSQVPSSQVPSSQVPSSQVPSSQVPSTEAGESTTESGEKLNAATNPTEVDPDSAEGTPEPVAETEPVAEVEPMVETEPTAEAETAGEAEATKNGESEPVAEGASVPAADRSPPAPEVHESVKQAIPDQAKINKCVKEWQIGANRATQIVHWLCEPFGDSDVSGSPPAVMTHMPTTSGLKPGDSVIGVVVSVMPFGVFVELAPDCSGLIHVSRISESFVEDLHEAIQVGDIVSAWVIGIDEKRRRVGLSAVSPARAQELEEQRQARGDRRPHRRGGQPQGGSRGGTRGGSRGGERNQQTGGGTGRSTGGGKPAAKSGQAKSGDGRRGKDRPGGRASGPSRGGRDRGRGGRGRSRTPETYRVESKEEVKPITEEMQTGKEPMRTFGDLAQFFGRESSTEPAAEAPKSKPPTPNPPASDPPASDPPASDPPSDSADTAAPQSEQPPAPQSESQPSNDSTAADSTSEDSNAPDAPTP